MKHAKSGMIEVRNLIAIYIVLIMLPIAVSIFSFCASFDFNYEEINDEVALYKLRKIYLISYEQEVSDDCVYFEYNNKNYELSLINNHLILRPGTQIFLEDIDSIHFYEEDDCLKIEYQRGKDLYEKVIGPKERLHFDDFSCDNDVLPELDDSVLVSSE